ncbi:gustatory receptor for sugar taste 43a-like [Myzus persicae]|uniref:gustatory receptor for sugar taste 43a-like n=1 Tax=Myzus persicae TaxID=13164 RepID=UPI000B93011D|nr:gustatory receptor for sugar taste 43a-like [Myzus persicae]
MFRPIAKWSVFIFDVFSVTSVVHNKWQIIYSALLIISCVYVFYTTPQIVCALEDNCDNTLSTFIKGMFARLVALTCMISRCVIFLKGRTHLVMYKQNIDNFHAYTPMTSSETDRLKKMSSRAVLCCTLLTIPVNVCRLWILYHVAKQTVPFVALVYIQNFSMYCIETHFSVLCYILYQKIVGINNDLMALKIDTIVRNKYPFVSLTGEKYGKPDTAIEYNREVFQSLIAGRPMIDFLENLKTKHKLVSQSVKNLNNTFGIHLGLSLCSLCLYTLFDLYYHLQAVWKHSKYKILVYGWILQYFVRFLFITVLAHITTKQALKSKILITDINNRYLDNNTKEELQLFLNQISSCTIEFTACDFFTLNTHLITSAIAAGTTYLVILLQFNSSNK